MQLVVIDPGHGGTAQRGSSSPIGVLGGRGTREKDLTLALAHRLRARLAPDVRVHLTRDGDENRSLGERADVARKLGARAFLSLHGNGGPRGRRGTETWVHSAAGPSARLLADGVARALVPVLGPGHGVQSGPMSVLDPQRLGPIADGCLVEIDYLTDDEGERRLNEPSTLDAIATALAEALRSHLDDRDDADEPDEDDRDDDDGFPADRYGRRAPPGRAGTEVGAVDQHHRMHAPTSAHTRLGAAASYWPEKYPVIGMDVSAAQGKIDWNAVHGWKNPDGNPIRFCFIKASEYKVDDSFDRNWALACGSQRHEAEAVLAHLVSSLNDAGISVTRDDVRDDLATVSDDGSYPYIDGGMGAISETAAHVLVHILRSVGGMPALIAEVIKKHGGSAALGDEMVAALDAGKSIEPRLLEELTTEAVAAAPTADRAKLRARFDKLLASFKSSELSYYFSPSSADAPIVRGPYHYFHPSRSATAQAQRLFDAVAASGGLRAEDLPPVIDFETDDGSLAGLKGAARAAAQTTIANALADCLAEVERLFGRTPILYASPGLWDTYINPADNARFARYPLWAARYDRGDDDATSLDPSRTPSHALGFGTVWTDPPSFPSYAAGWSFWQIRIVPPNEVDGVRTKLDCDVFNGDLAALNALTARPATATGSGLALGGPPRRPTLANPRARGLAHRFGAGSHERYPRRA